MTLSEGYNGLTAHAAGLAVEAYFDPGRYDRELRLIWNRNWVYVCRGTEVAGARAYRSFELGDQSVLLVRGEDGVLRGFHNTCRHRAGQLVRDVQNTSQSFIREMERAADASPEATPYVAPPYVAPHYPPLADVSVAAPVYTETPIPAPHELVTKEAALGPHPGAAAAAAHDGHLHSGEPAP